MADFKVGSESKRLQIDWFILTLEKIVTRAQFLQLLQCPEDAAVQTLSFWLIGNEHVKNDIKLGGSNLVVFVRETKFWKLLKVLEGLLDTVANACGLC